MWKESLKRMFTKSFEIVLNLFILQNVPTVLYNVTVSGTQSIGIFHFPFFTRKEKQNKTKNKNKNKNKNKQKQQQKQKTKRQNKTKQKTKQNKTKHNKT